MKLSLPLTLLLLLQGDKLAIIFQFPISTTRERCVTESGYTVIP